MCTTQVHCPQCHGTKIKNFGYSNHGIPRYRCCNDECETKTFMLEYRYKAYEPGIKKQVIEMAKKINLGDKSIIHVGGSVQVKCWCFPPKHLTVCCGEESSNSGKLPCFLASGSVPILNLN